MEKLTKEEILRKAKTILKHEEKEYNRLCFEAGICPECGNALKKEFVRTSMSIGNKYFCCNFEQFEMRTRPSLT